MIQNIILGVIVVVIFAYVIDIYDNTPLKDDDEEG